ncbi:MAG: hypothetical protein ABI564_16665, partial [Ideonella sp.]
MPTMIQTVSGTVTGLWGKAMIRGKDGKMHPLQVGDLVVKGDVILTSQDGIVQLNPDQVVPIAKKDDVDIEPAAGGGGSLLEGLRVGRIAEATTSTELNQTQFFDRARIEATTVAASPGLPTAIPESLVVNEDTVLPIKLTGRDPDGFLTAITITHVPTGGVLYKGDGTPIAENT